jgi:hypothetical protein
MDRQKPQETSDTYEADMHINPPEWIGISLSVYSKSQLGAFE